MVKVSEDIWTLLAKYLFDEAEPEEYLLAEEILKNDVQLLGFYQQVQALCVLKESREPNKASRAFMKLDKRIKAQNGKSRIDH